MCPIYHDLAFLGQGRENLNGGGELANGATPNGDHQEEDKS